MKLFNIKLKPLLYENIFKNKTKLSGKLNNLIKEFISSKGKEIFNKELSELLTYSEVSNFSNKFAKSAGKLLEKNKSIYGNKIEQVLNSKVKNIDLALALENYKVDILEVIVDNLMVVHKKTVDKYKNYKVKDIVRKYFHKEELYSLLINKGYPMLINKLPNLLDGNIKKFASNNLKKYDEDQICNIVQDFMGGQLKPLSVFGAVLGVVVGVLYELIYPTSMGFYGFPSSLLDVGISCVVMAFIGYITNVIALWMIFHPYKENKIVAKIPFFKKFALGYIPAHRNEFARGMAKLIDEELLNKEEINKAYNMQKDNMQSRLVSLVENNNYQAMVNLIRDKKQALAKYIYSNILKYCNDKSSLSKKLTNAIANTEINKFIKKDNVLNMVPKLIGNIKNLENSLAEFSKGKLSENCKVNDVLSESISTEIMKYVNEQTNILLQDKISNIKYTDIINKIINKFSGSYDIEIKKSCEDIFSNEVLGNMKNNMEAKVQDYVSNDLKVHVGDFVKQFLRSGLDENKTIGLMFNGKIKSIVDSNLYLLTNHLTVKLTNYLKENQDKISLNVQETIKNELNFFEKMAYGAFGGDDIADRVVSIVLNEKLPVMIKDETDKIVSVARVTLNESVYPMKTGTLKIKADEINTVILLENIFEQFSNNTNAKGHISKVSNLILASF